MIGFLGAVCDGSTADVLRHCYDRGTALALLGGNLVTCDAASELILPQLTKVAPMMMYQCMGGHSSSPVPLSVSGRTHDFTLYAWQ
jgi:hypothetical protein